MGYGRVSVLSVTIVARAWGLALNSFLFVCLIVACLFNPKLHQTIVVCLEYYPRVQYYWNVK